MTVKALENRPVLLPGLELYFQAYNELSFDRPVGLSVGFIPWSSIVKWCEINGIYDIDDMSTCIRYIRALEKIDLELSERKAAKK